MDNVQSVFCFEAVKSTKRNFHEVIIYDVTCFGLTDIFRHHSSTVGRLRDGYIVEDKVKHNYNDKTTEE